MFILQISKLEQRINLPDFDDNNGIVKNVLSYQFFTENQLAEVSEIYHELELLYKNRRNYLIEVIHILNGEVIFESPQTEVELK